MTGPEAPWENLRNLLVPSVDKIQHQPIPFCLLLVLLIDHTPTMTDIRPSSFSLLQPSLRLLVNSGIPRNPLSSTFGRSHSCPRGVWNIFFLGRDQVTFSRGKDVCLTIELSSSMTDFSKPGRCQYLTTTSLRKLTHALEEYRHDSDPKRTAWTAKLALACLALLKSLELGEPFDFYLKAGWN